MNLILIGGLPGSGKSTLAAQVAARYGWPLLAKDQIKEALMDSLLGPDAPFSRNLSNAAFEVQFRLALPIARASTGLILEGNFRPAEHTLAMRSILDHEPRLRLIQVLCRIDEGERHRRLEQRRLSGIRHEGHQELSATVKGDHTADGFLDLPGARIVHSGIGAGKVLEALDRQLEAPH